MIYLLAISFFICHYFADYTHLSTAWMLKAKRFGTPLFPIFIHAAVHTGLMAWVVLFMSFFQYVDSEQAIIALSLQLFSHFIIDVLKGKVNVWFPEVQNPAEKPHWYIFGLDQLLHHAVILLMVYLILG